MSRLPELTTLCYIEQDNKYLMLHRVSKKNDINKDKWIGVGGHFEDDESPEECAKREIFEETGYDIALEDLKYRAVVTFVSQKGDYELMSLFTAKAPDSEPKECDEGKLEWVKKDYDIISFAYISDNGVLHIDADLSEENIKESFGCDYGDAIFELKKK